MKKNITLLLSLFLMFGLGVSAQETTELPVKTIKGISVAMNGTDTLAVFGVTEAYGNTEASFKALACVVPKGQTTDENVEAGICYSPFSIWPSLADSIYSFGNQSRVKDVTLKGLNSGTTYYYRVFVKSADGNVAYGRTYSSTTQPGVSICPDSHHPHVVDLGLPSGTKWACCNVGASKPEDYGGYYAYGETEEKTNYTWQTYLYGDGNNNTTLGSIQGGVYDVAHVRMGEQWKMPTIEEFDELFKCSWQWKSINGINGLLFIGANGKQLFIPAAGVNGQIRLVDVNELCSYWSSSRQRSFYIVNGQSFLDNLYLCVGLPVRGICK